MNRLSIRFVIIIFLSFFSLTVFAQQKKVAVYVTGQQTAVNKVLGDKLVEAFAKSGKYIAIERTSNFLAELSKEQNYQRTGAVDDNELSRLGKQFGVQLVCVADISEVFGQKYVSARLINVESAEVVNTSNTNSTLDKMEELLKVADKITKELTDKTVQEKTEEEEAKQKAQVELNKNLEKAVSDGYIQVDNIMFVVSKNYPAFTSYNQAKKAAQKMSLGGYTDWRLPTSTEIMIIMDFCERNHKIYSQFPSSLLRYGCADNYYVENGRVVKYYGGFSCAVIFVRDVKERDR